MFIFNAKPELANLFSALTVKKKAHNGKVSKP